MNKDRMFIVSDDTGKQTLYEMLKVKNVDGVPVIWYTDNTVDEEGNKNIYISSYEKTEHSFILNELNQEEIEKYAKIYLEENKDK